jgi:hypothetical protein
MRPGKCDTENRERMPEVVLNRGLIGREQLGREPRLQRVRPERAQSDRGRSGQGAENEKQLQRVFFVFFTRCGRFLP